MNSAAPALTVAASSPPDLSSPEERARLTPGAVKAFFNILDLWGVKDVDGRSLLGGPSNGRYYGLKKSPQHPLSQDELTRISLLVGVFKALNILFSDGLADQWVRLPNANPLFRGAAPLKYMIRGGLPAIQTVRRLLDGRRG